LAELQALALRAPVFLGSLTRKTRSCAPSPHLYIIDPQARLMIYREYSREIPVWEKSANQESSVRHGQANRVDKPTLMLIREYSVIYCMRKSFLYDFAPDSFVIFLTVHRHISYTPSPHNYYTHLLVIILLLYIGTQTDRCKIKLLFQPWCFWDSDHN
jgi:hypothetical protein